MKIVHLIAFLSAAPLALWADDSAYSVVERGPHHALLSRLQDTVWPEGVGPQEGVRTQEPHYLVALETGMNYLEGGQWTESREAFDVTPDGIAAAIHGQVKVWLNGNLNTLGAVSIEVPGGQRLRLNVVGLALTDRASGRSVRIADLQDCDGFLVADNRVVFRDAFHGVNGGLLVDVEYVYTKLGFEQTVRLRSQLPHAPEDYGMARANCLLEIFSEVVEGDPAVVAERLVASETDPAKRAAMAAPDLVEQTLELGQLRFIHGRGFTTGLAQDEDGLLMGKTYESWGLRRFIVEHVRYGDIEPVLQQLPAAPAPAPADGAKISIPDARTRRLARQYPAPLPAQGQKASRITRLAAAGVPEKALVLDYTTINSSQSNIVFQADTCYYITNTVYLTGVSNVLEGGSVLKFGRNACLRIDGAIRTATGLYRPCVLTGSADATVGEPISGTLSGTYASPAIMFDCGGTNAAASLQNLRILYATTGVQFEGGSGHELRHIQFGNCGTAVKSDGANFAVRNVLGWNLTNAMIGTTNGGSGTAPTGVWEHATFNQVTNLVTTNANGTATVSAFFTNSLLVGVVGTNGLAGANNAVAASSNGVFTVAGGGQGYLADGSIYRGAGTTNINASLLADLAWRTTCAPTNLGNLSGTMVLTPLAVRGEIPPDLGFHYAPLDFWASGIILDTNALVIATNGVAIGVDVSTNGWGLQFKNGARLISDGPALSLNRLVRAHTAQEKSGGNPGTRALLYDGLSTTANCELRLRFTEVAQLQNDGPQIYVGSKFSAIEWLHSQIYNLNWVDNLSNSAAQTFGLTNTVLERGTFSFCNPALGGAIHARNDLFRNLQWMDFNQGSSNILMTNSSFVDNLFDHVSQFADGCNPVGVSNNAYSQLTFAATGCNDRNRWTNCPGKILLTNLVYDIGPLGNYYQPTNSPLINAGSRTADLGMLFHFCTTTNQVKETNSVVDIGPHAIALDATGKPLDSDGNGIFDYQADRNGNGLLDSGETDWKNAKDIGFSVRISRPRNGDFSPNPVIILED